MRANERRFEIQMQTQTDTNEIIHPETTLETGKVNQSLCALFEVLHEARNIMEPEQWSAFSSYARTEQPLCDEIHQDPMTRRAFDKPRGYAGDAVMMDYLYGIHSADRLAADTSPLGQEIYRYIQSRPAGQAVRFRREHLAQRIDEIAAGRSGISVLAIAAGHLREAELSAALASGAIERFVALDADPDSLREVEANYCSLGIETIHASVRHLLARKVDLDAFDFVYAAGLYDYLNDAVAQALTARMFELTKAGGQMLIPNFAPSLSDIAYMETYMDWKLIYRDEYDMTQLLARIDPSEIESYDVYSDPTGSVVYLSVKKRSS